MLPKFTVTKLVLLPLLALSFVICTINTTGANPQDPPINCQTDSNETIQKAIHKKIMDEPTLASEVRGLRSMPNADGGTTDARHLSISYKNGAVTIRGFVSGRARFNKVIELVKSVSCVKRDKINTTNFKPFGTGGCNPPNRLCGILCIGPDDPCDLVGE